MNDHLKSLFRKEEIELAGSIGAQSGELKDKVIELFQKLSDPLLSASDVQELLGGDATSERVLEALAQLCASNYLEQSSKTLRPLDPEGTTLYRLAGVPFTRLKLFGVESFLSDGTSRYQFTCDGRLIRSIARVDRLDSLLGKGQQRDEIKKHVGKIAAGIVSGTQVPNSILLILLRDHVVAAEESGPPESFIIVRPLSEELTVPSPVESAAIIQRCRSVEIDFPYRRAAFDEEKSALLVDGQQRTAALSLVDVDKVPSFSFSVNATLADSEQAKAIFLVSNSTVKIETQFSRALLASMDETPGYLLKEQPRALAVKILALEDDKSPFYQLAQYPGAKPKGRPPLAYNSLFQVVSTFADTGLTIGQDARVLAATVARAFQLVAEAWPDAWGKPPKESKLMHGAGVRAVAGLLAIKLETAFAQFPDIQSDELWKSVQASLQRLQPNIVWRVADTQDATFQAKKNWKEIQDRQKEVDPIVGSGNGRC